MTMIAPIKPPAPSVFAGLDPGGGASLVTDIQTAAAPGAHAPPIATTLTDANGNIEVTATRPYAAQ